MILLLLGCAQPEPAPRDQDTLTHDVFLHWFVGDIDAVTTDIADIREKIDADDLPLDGTVTNLDAAEAAAAGAPDVPVTTAVGLLTVGWLDCTADELERLITNEHQDQLYTENYTVYERTYTSSESAFVEGADPFLTWDTHYGVHIPATGDYTADILGGLSRSDDLEGGPGIVSTTVMPAAAVTDPETIVFDVDFQVEVYWPHDGGMVHYYGMWRHIDLGNGLGTDSDLGVTVILNGLHDWDDTTSGICAAGI